MKVRITSHKPIKIEMTIEENAIEVVSEFDGQVVKTVEKRPTKNIFVQDNDKKTIALIEYLY